MSTNDQYMEFGIGEGDDAFQGKANRYKGKEGRTDRLSIAWWPVEDGKMDLDAKTPRFIGAPRIYIKGVGYVLVSSPEHVKFSDGGKPAKKAIATVVIQWPTDSHGVLDKAKVAKEFRVMSWTFSTTRYDSLARMHSGDWPLGQHDFLFACTDSQYQKGELQPCKENLLRVLMEKEKEGVEEIRSRILAQIAEVESTIQGDLARTMTLDQIREKLGQEGAALSGVVVDENVVDGLLDDLGV